MTITNPCQTLAPLLAPICPYLPLLAPICSVLCSHYHTWDQDSQDHLNYRLCCSTPPKEALWRFSHNRKFLNLKK